MNLLQHIQYRITFDKVLEEELLTFKLFFLSKGCTEEDFEGIEALADKIRHMTLYIGCPNSVLPMLNSIANRRLKYWQADRLFYGEMEQRGFIKGKQIKRKSDFKLVVISSLNKNKTKGIIKGHFRWNNRGYILSRRCTDLLTQYLNYE